MTASADLEAVARNLRRSTVRVNGNGGTGGTGVIWNASGAVITNSHVVSEEQAVVELPDGRGLPASVTARDSRRDLAALAVEGIAGAEFTPAQAGDSSRLRTGELVLALGHPLGLSASLTVGIIHQVPRRGSRWVQADISLAPGNSGGPLADAAGRVIGINSMIAGGLAMAVPSNAVGQFLASGGRRPWIGITVRPVADGLLVLEVEPGGPAADAGLLAGDVLTAPFDLTEGNVRLEVRRGGKHIQCDVFARRKQAA